MRKTYRVHFVDDYGVNQKLLEARSLQDIYDYMSDCGYTIVKIEEV